MHDGTRFTLQEIFLSSLTNFLYDDGRDPAGDPSWWGLQKKEAIAHWANRIELLAMVQDTNDGEFLVPPPQGGAVRPDPGPLAVGLFTYALSDQSIAVRQAANAAKQQVAEHGGLGRFMGLTETRGAYVAHPLGGCYGYEGLYCIDASIIPTLAGGQPLADDLGRVRAPCRCAGGAGRRPRAPRAPGRAPARPAAGERGRARDPAGGTVAASAAPAPQAPSAPPEPASEGADPAIDWPASVSDADPPRSSGSREACDLTEPLG